MATLTLPDSRYTVDTSLSKQKNEATQLGRTRALSKLLFNEGGGALGADLMYKLYVAEVVNPVTGGSKVRADEYAKDKQVAEASEKLRRLDEKSQTDARALIQDYADGAGFPKRWAAERLSLAADGKAPSATDPALTPKPPGAPSAKAAEPRTQSSDGAIRPGQMPSLVYQPARRLRD